MKNTIKFIALTALLGLSLNVSCAFAQANTTTSLFKVEAYGVDSIAGYPAHIYSSRTLADKNVIFNVTKPDGTILSIPVLSDKTGVAEFDLYDFHTQKAGEYKVSAKLEESAASELNIFRIYADEVSDFGSKVDASKLVANSDGIDKIYLTVTLADKYNNPIKDHSIEVISSRPEDKIQKISSKSFTDENGKIMFAVSSAKKGVSVYSFMDSTTNQVLKTRLEIAYTSLKDAGGFIEDAYAETGVIAKLSFSDLPLSISPNSDVSFTLSALDSEDAVVPNYSGSVHFSAEGSNSVYAKLPNDYTFDVDMDTGIKQFSGPNSLNFSQPGTYIVVATDLNDFTIRGETEIVVGTGGNTTTPPATVPSDEIIISSPTAGTYGDKQLPITGTAPEGAQTVQIFDNDVNIGSTQVEDNMSYTYQPTQLQDGQHKVFVVALDMDGTILMTSEEVNFTIDSTPPEVLGIKFTPSKGIKTGDVIDITVTSDASVSQGAVVFNVDIAELESDPNEPTHYLASIQAPLEAGTYPIDVILVDDLGNEGSYEDVATVEVTDAGTASVTGNDETPPDEVTPPADEKPGDVFGVTSTPSDQRVSLNWQPATDDKGIKNYKIYYGLSAANLNMSVITQDNKTTWYIPNLKNGNEYFFAVSSIDTTGQESENRSSLVSGIPFSSEPILYIPPEETVRPTAPVMQSTGPEMIWFVLASIFISKLYFKKRSKVC